MHSLWLITFACTATVVFIVQTVHAQNGLNDNALEAPNQGLRRKIKLALFFSKSLIDSWTTAKNKPTVDLSNYLESTFLNKYNALWAEPQLGSGIDIKFEIARIQYLTAREENELRSMQLRLAGTHGEYAGATAFCEWSKQQPTRGRPWNVPVYIIDPVRQADFNARTPGRAYGMGEICDKNCVVMEGRVVSWRLEPLYANLLAHEVGHVFGFQHPPTECHADIMWAPGNNDKWSVCTKRKALEILSNQWVYPCLEYQYGTMPPPTVPPGMISDEDMEVLKKNCPNGVVDTHDNFKGKFYYANGYLDWFRRTPNWWHEENICKWMPCRQEYKSSALFVAITPMTGMRCGVNKLCGSDNRCASAGNSGCGTTRVLTRRRGNFMSYQYDGQHNYLPNLNCSWRLRAPRGWRLKVTFSAMDVRGARGCGGGRFAGDSVNIYDGEDATAPRIAALCNGDTSYVKSSSNVLFVTFTSDYDPTTVGKGFKAMYKYTL